MIKKILLYVLYLLALVSLLLVYSYRNPGRFVFIDRVRVPAQSAIMSHLSYYNLNQIDILNEEAASNNKTMSINDLMPYLQDLQPGDILFTNSEKYLSSQFIPGSWKHAVIYLGCLDTLAVWFDKNSEVWRAIQASTIENKEYLIFDSSVEGVSIRHISCLSNLKDQSLLVAMAAFRIARDHQTIKEFITHAFTHIGKNYDYDLLTGNTEALYCSELVYESLKHIGIYLPVKERVYGRDIISPDGAAHYIMNEGIEKSEFCVVFNSNNPH